MLQVVYPQSQSNFFFPFSFMTIPFLVLWIPTNAFIFTKGEQQEVSEYCGRVLVCFNGSLSWCILEFPMQLFASFS